MRKMAASSFKSKLTNLSARPLKNRNSTKQTHRMLRKSLRVVVVVDAVAVAIVVAAVAPLAVAVVAAA